MFLISKLWWRIVNKIRLSILVIVIINKESGHVDNFIIKKKTFYTDFIIISIESECDVNFVIKKKNLYTNSNYNGYIESGHKVNFVIKYKFFQFAWNSKDKNMFNHFFFFNFQSR